MSAHRCFECGAALRVVVELDLSTALDAIESLSVRLDSRLKSIDMKEKVIMATIADVNTKLTEIFKDVQRVLALVLDNPTAAATQAEVDALAERLDSLDAEVEAVSPEPTDPNVP